MNKFSNELRNNSRRNYNFLNIILIFTFGIIVFILIYAIGHIFEQFVYGDVSTYRTILQTIMAGIIALIMITMIIIGAIAFYNFIIFFFITPIKGFVELIEDKIFKLSTAKNFKRRIK